MLIVVLVVDGAIVVVAMVVGVVVVIGVGVVEEIVLVAIVVDVLGIVVLVLNVDVEGCVMVTKLGVVVPLELVACVACVNVTKLGVVVLVCATASETMTVIISSARDGWGGKEFFEKPSKRTSKTSYHFELQNCECYRHNQTLHPLL